MGYAGSTLFISDQVLVTYQPPIMFYDIPLA